MKLWNRSSTPSGCSSGSNNRTNSNLSLISPIKLNQTLNHRNNIPSNALYANNPSSLHSIDLDSSGDANHMQSVLRSDTNWALNQQQQLQNQHNAQLSQIQMQQQFSKNVLHASSQLQHQNTNFNNATHFSNMNQVSFNNNNGNTNAQLNNIISVKQANNPSDFYSFNKSYTNSNSSNINLNRSNQPLHNCSQNSAFDQANSHSSNSLHVLPTVLVSSSVNSSHNFSFIQNQNSSHFQSASQQHNHGQSHDQHTLSSFSTNANSHVHNNNNNMLVEDMTGTFSSSFAHEIIKSMDDGSLFNFEAALECNFDIDQLEEATNEVINNPNVIVTVLIILEIILSNKSCTFF